MLIRSWWCGILTLQLWKLLCHPLMSPMAVRRWTKRCCQEIIIRKTPEIVSLAPTEWLLLSAVMVPVIMNWNPFFPQTNLWCKHLILWYYWHNASFSMDYVAIWRWTYLWFLHGCGCSTRESSHYHVPNYLSVSVLDRFYGFDYLSTKLLNEVASVMP